MALCQSNAIYRAFGAARRSAKEHGSLVRQRILNAPTKLMKALGYGQGYAYDHDARSFLQRGVISPTAWSSRPLPPDEEEGLEKRLKEAPASGGPAPRAAPGSPGHERREPSRGGCRRE
ncbi:MAG: hypothetical protein R3C69_16335 [Geminicoccaceae bacterium]